MSLAKRVEQGPPSDIRGGTQCGFAAMLATLPKAERAALDAMMGDYRWRHSDIAAALADEGHEFAAQIISRHRRGLCRRCSSGS